MTNKEKIQRLENLLEYFIINDSPAMYRNKSQIDILRHIESVVSLQNTISDLRHKQNLKDQNIYKGEID
jgi:hypothetical protein